MHFSQVLICLASSSSAFIQTFILHGQKQLREEGELPGTHQLSCPARTHSLQRHLSQILHGKTTASFLR